MLNPDSHCPSPPADDLFNAVSPPRAALFDMDGLLIDSEPTWFQVMGATLEADYGIHLPPEAVHPFQGVSTARFATSMAARFPQAEIDPQRLCLRILASMYDRAGSLPLLPGARELLTLLTERDVPLAIASSSPTQLIERVIADHGLPVTIYASATEVERTKPDPGVFLLAAQRLGVAPERCVVWEDSLNGVIAAKAATMTVVAVPERRQARRPQFHIADHVCGSLAHSQRLLPGLLPRQFGTGAQADTTARPDN